MKTYQDWLKVANESERQRMDFILALINEHKASKEYRDAKNGENYYNGQNTTIKQVEKMIYNAKGQAVPDYVSANHKIATRFFYRSIKQATSTLLGNGVSWTTGEGLSLGDDFDKKIVQIARGAMVEGCCFGFWNYDHVEVYNILEFVPLLDEEDGAVKAGARFWQLSSDKPLRVTFFELDGYTDYRYNDGIGEVMVKKRPYILKTMTSEADGTIIYDGENYPTFPIIPCYANITKTSELNPIRATIDSYDLINSGYANDVDDANIIYWTITNAGGMDDVDLVRVLDKLRKLHMAQLDDDQQIQSHSVDIPYAGREAILDRLEKQLYKDSMSLNTYDISGGAVTATQIQAAYEPLNEKLDDLEGYITDFIQRLMAVAGIEDAPTYDRSLVINRSEDVDDLMKGALYLDDIYITQKLMTLFGDKDKIDEVISRKAESDISRLTNGTET